MEITKDNLPDKMECTKQLLGQSFVESLEDQYETLRKKSLPKWVKDIQYENLHPFYHWWRSLQYCCIQSASSEKLQLTEHSIRALRLLDDLVSLEHVPNFKRLLEDIRKQNKFHSTVFEASIAAGYLNTGHEISIPEETGSTTPQHDFIIHCADEDVAVECKSMEDDQDKLTCQRLAEVLCKRASEAAGSVYIDIVIERSINTKLRGQIIADVAKLLKQRLDQSKSNESRNGYTITINWLPNPEVINKKEFQLWPMRKPEFVVFGMILSPLVRELEKATIVTISRSIPNVLPKRAMRVIKEARRQLPNNSPCVIHLGVPYQHTSFFVDFMDQTYNDIYKYINVSSRRIAAVVASALSVDISCRPPWKDVHYAIPSFHSRLKLPPNFRLLGSNDMKLPIDIKEFTFDLGFVVPRDLSKSIQSSILDHSSNDGRNQLRIWNRSTNRLRLELTNVFHPRAILEWDGNLEPGSRHRLVSSCGTESIMIWFDGQKYSIELNNATD